MQAFPDALDLLLICVEAGMSIEAAIQKVSQEIGGASIDLAEELTLLSAELSYLPDRRLAYDGLAKRTNHPGVRAVAAYNSVAARFAAGHDDANVLCLGGKTHGEVALAEILQVFFSTPFEGGRHADRVKKLDALDGARGGC